MVNIEMDRDGDILTLRIDLKKRNGPSKSGKTTIVASTHGNVDVGDGIKLGVNCYVKE